MDSVEQQQPGLPQRRLNAAYLAVALLAFGVALLAWEARARAPLLERIDRLSLDTQTQWRGRLAPASAHPITLVTLDDASLQRLGTFAPDRRLLAQAIERLTAADAQLIALDLLLLEPARPDATSDLALAQAMQASGRVLIPFAFSAQGPASAEFASNTLLANAFTRFSDEAAQRRVALLPTGLLAPIAPLAAAAVAMGHVTAQRGSDGALRYDLPALSLGGEVYPSLALRIAALASAEAWSTAQMQFGHQVLLGKGGTGGQALAVPVDLLSRQWLNYYGPAGSFPSVSFVDVLDGRLAAGALRGHIVIIGSSALGTADQFPTPFDAAMPGVERLATVVDNILSRRVLTRPAWGALAEVLAMLALPLLAVGLIRSARLRWALPALALLSLALAAALQALFLRQQMFLSPAFPLLGLVLAMLGAITVRTAAEQARKRAALRALQVSEARYALAAQGANDGLWDWDIAADAVYFSERWRGLMGLEVQQASAMAAWTAPLAAAHKAAFEAALAEHLAGRSGQFHHILNFREGGAERWLLARGVATRAQDGDGRGRALRMAGSLTDITEQQQLQQQLSFDAVHDRQTGLPNRTLCLDRLGELLRRSRATTGVVLVDIDGFRTLNEQHGTPAGDALLIEVAGRLGARAGVATDLARLAADRFALLFSAAPEPGGINDGGLAVWALAQLALPFTLGAQALNVGASVGWAHASQVQGQADELLAAAEQALAHAKATARGRVHAYDPAEHLLETARRWTQANIDLGLERSEFRLFYQPLVRLSDRKLLGFEALIRWPHPSRGMVMPDEFIRHAEASGQIVPLSGWIMREAARQLRAWDALGFQGEIAINLSAVQFSDRELLQAEARAVLAILGPVAPQRIKMEVTESESMKNPQATTWALKDLVALGFKISIDDFGTGYSSLAYLSDFPFDTLKIDRSFVIRLVEGRKAVEIVRTIVGLALALDKQVIAEGIDDERQAALLQELGVHVGQGWLFAKALPAEAAEALITARFAPDHAVRDQA